MDMQWTAPKPPTIGTSYDHVVAYTPIGAIRIEWPSWKKEPSYTCRLPGGLTIVECSLVEAQESVRKALVDLAREIHDMASDAEMRRALTAIANGEGDAQEIARQTLKRGEGGNAVPD